MNQNFFMKPSGTFNYAGRKATKEQIEAGQGYRKVGTYEMRRWK